MLRKILASLRDRLSSKKSEPARSEAVGMPHPTSTKHREQHQKGAKGDGRRQGKASESRPAKGPKAHGHERSGPRQAASPRSEAPRPTAPKPAERPPETPAVIDVPKVESPFTALGLTDALGYAVQQLGYNEPTPIQQQAIPIVLSGRDVIGSAQTGTGKTAAFALPILQRLGQHGRMRCLVLEPTRELALQVEEAFRKFSKYTHLRATVVYGGVGYGKQREDLHRGVDVLVATPGRLLDHMEQGDVKLDHIEVLVLDEVDRMLDMGFLPDVKRIVQKCAKDRQTLFFTATLPAELAQLASWALRNPAEVRIGATRTPAETVSHAFYPVVAAQKFDLLEQLLKRTEFKSVIIFSRTKFGADKIARRLIQGGHTVGVIHADRNQRERVEALEGFKSGKYEVLVATDIAARGLDIAGVSHVINYDVPENPEDYVHRIGRTGRAQSSGDAFTLVTEDDVRDARSIERFINASIERKRLDDFPYIYSALFDEKAQPVAAKPASRLHRGGRR